MAHLRNCLEIAANAAAEGKRYSLAILYDEICRREWSQKASRGKHCCPALWPESVITVPLRGDKDFSVNTACVEKDKELLDRARSAYIAAATGAKGNQPLFL